MSFGFPVCNLLGVDRRADGELLRTRVELALQPFLASLHLLDLIPLAAAGSGIGFSAPAALFIAAIVACGCFFWHTRFFSFPAAAGRLVVERRLCHRDTRRRAWLSSALWLKVGQGVEVEGLWYRPFRRLSRAVCCGTRRGKK